MKNKSFLANALQACSNFLALTDSHPTADRLSQLTHICRLTILLLTLNVGQMWGADTWYILGPDGSWETNTAHAMVSSGITNWVYKSMSPSGQWSNFKVRQGTTSTYYGKDSGGNNVTIGTLYSPTTSGGDMYCDFSQYSSMSYYFFFNTSTKKLMIQPNYYLAGTCGANNQNWGTNNNPNTYDATNGYFKWNTCTLTANSSYEFKLTNGQGTAWTYTFEDWSGVTVTSGTKTSNNSGNITFKPTYGGTAVIVFVPTNNNMVIHCPYQVSYNKGANGTGTIAAGSKTWNTSFTLSSSTFTRTGYTQDGWSTSDGGSKAYNLGGSYTTNDNVTLYPHWTANTYTVTLNTNSGTINAGDVKSYTYGVGATLPTNVTRKGYLFGGWYESNTFSGSPVTSISATATGDKTYHAKWTPITVTSVSFSPANSGTTESHSFTMTFTTNAPTGGSYQYAIREFVASGSSYGAGYQIGATTIPSATVTTGTMNPGMFNSAGTYKTQILIMKSGNVEYASDDYTYTVGDASDPSWSMYNDATKLGDFTNNGNGSHSLIVTIPAGGYSLLHYNNDQGFVGATGAESLTTERSLVNNNGRIAWQDGAGTFRITIRKDGSTWKIKAVKVYTVTYDDNGATSGSVPTDANYYTSGSTVTVKTNSGSLAKTGYTFGGWNTNTSGTGTNYTAGTGTFSITEDKILYAKWNETIHTVTVDRNNTTLGTVNTTSVSAGASTASATITATPVTGATFTGWTIPLGVTLASGTASSQSITIYATADKTITANFSETTYTVNVALAVAAQSTGTTSPNGDTQVGAITPVQITAPTPKTGYLPTGRWTTTGGVTVANSTANPTTITATSTGTVRWTFDEDLTTTWVLKGSFVDDFGTAYAFTKKTGESTESVAYTTVSLSANTTYRFKVVNTSGNTWYGNDNSEGDGTYYIKGNVENWEFKTSDGNCFMTTTLAGTYTFKINFSGANPLVSVYYPEIYAISGSFNSWSESNNLAFTGNDGSYEVTINGSSTNYDFKVLDNAIWYGHADKTFTTTESNVTLASGGSNIKLKADVYPNGTYTFTYNKSTKKLGVTYPTSHVVNFGKRTGGSTVTAKINNTTAINTGTKIKPGTSVTFAQTAATGYTFEGWYDAASGGTKLSSSATYTTTISAATTVYANYTENSYNVTVTKTIGGSVTPTAVTSMGQVTGGSITATKSTGYNFTNWTITSGTGYFGTSGTNTTSTTANTKFRPTAAATIKATFTPKTYTITLNKNEGTGGTNSVTATYNSATLSSSITNPTKTGYTFGGWYSGTGGTGSLVINSSGVLQANVSTYTGEGGIWTKDAATTLYAKWTPNNYSVSFNNNGGSGDTPTPINVTYDATYGTLPAGPTPPGADQFVGWSKTQTGTVDLVTADTLVTTAADHTLYARFEHTYTVTVNYKCGEQTLRASTTVHASESAVAADISAPDILGYKFDNWTGSNAIFAEPTSATTTVHATAATAITANYTAVPMVYFKNNLDWDNVYVSFDNTWKEIDDKQVPVNKDKPYYKMTQLGTSDIFYCEIPSDYVANNYANWKWNIAFDNTNYGSTAETTHTGTWNEFYGGKFLGRGDFDPSATMYIPYDGDTETRNSGTYYRTGCWMKYNSTDPGYKIYANTHVSGSGGSAVAGTPVLLTADVAGGFEFKATVNFPTANYSYGFMLKKEASKNTNDLWYSNNGQIYATTNTLPWDFSTEGAEENGQRCEIHTEAVGNYTFTVSFGTGRPVVNVEYPVGVGDWKLIYKDRATWSDGAHDANWHHDSRVIKAKASTVDTVSFFVAYGSTPSIALYKCTAINATTGAETWIKQSDVALGVSATGIYNYIVSQNASKEATAAFAGSYTGNYYIRTDASDGGWSNYKTSGANTMTYSEYSVTHGGDFGPYSHYFMRHVNSGSNIKFCIANDYSECISDTVVDDTYAHEWIEVEANIRFMWYYGTNKIGRAYVSGSSIVSDRFLVLEGDDKLYDADGNALTGTHQIFGLAEHEINFIDDQNWVYETTVQANPTARVKLTAKFNNKIQYFYGDEGDRAEATTYQLIGGTGSDKYKMRVVYDFKTNRLVCAWMPGNTVTTEFALDADIMMIRYHQGDAQQINFSGSGKLTDVKTVYGAMQFNKYRLNNQNEGDGHDDLGLSVYERDLFFISFPFDVKLNDVFGFGTYGKHWIIEYYDGLGRAQNGYWADSPSNWKFVTKQMKDTFTLRANTGYVLALALGNLNMSSPVWDYGVENVYLYFPSTATVKNIQATSRTININQNGYYCSINRPYGTDGDRRVKDSYWHLLGVPSYANALHETASSWTGNVPNLDPAAWTTSAPYVYNWVPSTNTFNVVSTSTMTFKSMYSYLAQYAGNTITWTQVNATPQAVAARRNANYKSIYEFRLELLQNGKEADHTFISLRDNDEVTAAFDFNYDLCKQLYGGFTPESNIYTVIDGNIEAAANCLPLLTEQVTTVPVAVAVKTAGEYTFTMPDGTEGMAVTLLDSETGKHVDLSIEDYTVELNAGTCEGRFYISIDPRNAATLIETVGGEGDELRNAKILRNGLLYIQRGENLYDATGKRID